MLAVLNSAPAFDYLKGTCSVLGDELKGGRLEFRAIYMKTLPIPDASAGDRASLAKLAKNALVLHAKRRTRVEQFLQECGLRRIGIEQSKSPLSNRGFCRPMSYLVAKNQPRRILTEVRDETECLTEQIRKLEAEIDVTVAGLYGIDDL